MHFRIAVRVDLVWDRYFDDSLKGTTRLRPGKGERRRVVPKRAIPPNWKINFLLKATFKFLSEALYKLFCSRGEAVCYYELKLTPLHDCSTLSPCSLVEAIAACCCMHTMQHTMVSTR